MLGADRGRFIDNSFRRWQRFRGGRLTFNTAVFWLTGGDDTPIEQMRGWWRRDLPSISPVHKLRVHPDGSGVVLYAHQATGIIQDFRFDVPFIKWLGLPPGEFPSDALRGAEFNPATGDHFLLVREGSLFEDPTYLMGVTPKLDIAWQTLIVEEHPDPPDPEDPPDPRHPDQLTGPAIDSSGDIFVGWRPTFSDLGEWAMAKFSPAGSELWRIYYDDVDDFAWNGWDTLTADESGSVYLVTRQRSGSALFQAIWLTRFDSNGNFTHIHTMGEARNVDQPRVMRWTQGKLILGSINGGPNLARIHNDNGSHDRDVPLPDGHIHLSPGPGTGEGWFDDRGYLYLPTRHGDPDEAGYGMAIVQTDSSGQVVADFRITDPLHSGEPVCAVHGNDLAMMFGTRVFDWEPLV